MGTPARLQAPGITRPWRRAVVSRPFGTSATTGDGVEARTVAAAGDDADGHRDISPASG